MRTIASLSIAGLSVDAANRSTTSASLSPGHEEVRRRSPQNTNNFDSLINETAGPLPALQRKQTIELPSNPRAASRVPNQPVVAKEKTIMFMNDIAYNNLGL